MSILLADDDAQLATFLSKSLESEGCSVHIASDAESVRAELGRQNYKLIILDLNLGNTDGLQLLQELRGEGLETPVIVLSARNQVSDRIQSLNLGADDYVTKPFSFQELSARVNAVLRRKADPSLSVLRVADLELDPVLRRVHRAKREIKFSPKEFALLQLLMAHAGETVSRRALHEEAWGSQETDSNLVDVYVNYLRKKIDSQSQSKDKLIHTVRGSGYRLGPPAPASSSASSVARSQQASAAQAKPPLAAAEGPAIAGEALEELVHSVAHDLAQPLTSVRCFLEVLASRKGGTNPPPVEVKSIEQQADRAIALSKGISALVREAPACDGPWISLDGLLNEVFEDFAAVLNSGLLTLDRQWDPSIQVTSRQALFQLLALVVSKLVGRNARPLCLTIGASLKDGHCVLDLRWRATDTAQNQVLDAGNILGKELPILRDVMYAMDGDLDVKQGRPEISLRLPAAPGKREAQSGFLQVEASR
jgi:two-component system copper resistance phosphate regulon response regulator CusR